jgi:glycerophosphoryl diester phosphodiesterase
VAQYVFTDSRFPNGTTLYATPLGFNDEPVSAAVASGSATFAGLRELTRYVVRGQVSGRTVESRFTSPSDSAGGSVQRTVTGLAEPWVMAHRMGGGNIAPDNSLSAMEATIALGHPITDGGDVRSGKDGSLLSCHDATVDRTMSQTGNVADQTAQSWRTLTLDPATWFATGWPTERPPYFEEILDRAARFGVVVTPEVKSNQPCAQNMVAAIQRRRLEQSVIFQSFTLSDLAFATAAGIKTMWLVTSAIAPATATAAGVNYVSYDYTQAFATGAWIASLISAGLKPVPYTLVRKTDWAAQQALGAVGCASDDPFYIAGTNPSLSSDPFPSQTWSHGMFDLGSPSAARGSFGAPKWWKCDMAGDKLVHQGWTRLPAAFTMDVRVRFDTIGAGGGTAIVFSGTNDLSAASSSGAGAGTGYMLYILPASGNQLRLYRKNGDGTQTQLQAANGTAITVDGSEATFRIVVTATTIKCDRTDVAVSLPLATDSTYRGEHLALGKAGADSRNSFADIVIS